ncbi:MAG: LamG-like jellyroll fold domain-containing protein [Verrucomicrobiota bacterium]|jgi:hypothetical protein
MKTTKSSLFGTLTITAALLIGWSANAQPTPPFSSSLVLNIPFDGSVVDTGPNDFTVNTNGGGTWVTNRFLQTNSAWSLNGVNQNIEIPYDARLYPEQMTLSLWVNVQSISSIQMMIWRAGNGSSDGWRGFDLFNSSGSYWYQDYTGSSGNANLSFAQTNIALGTWYQIVVTRTTNSAAVYVDGVQLASQTGLTPYTKPQTTPMSIGANNADPSGFNWFTPAVFDTVHIYNRALSTNEVAELYAYESVPQTTNPPSITGQPQSLVVNAHDMASFSVTASGSSPLYYQWTLNETNILDATDSTLTVTNVTQEDLGAYAVVVTDASGSTTSSNAMLSMYPFLAVPFGGEVTDWGQNAILSVQAWGTGPLSYQWYDDGDAVLNATNETLDLSSIQFTNAGLYSVVVSSPLGSVTNTPEQVVVNTAGVSLGMYAGVTITGTVGSTYVIQATSNLSDINSWVSVATLTLEQPVELWVDISANVSVPGTTQRFYRVLPGQ